MLYTNGFDNPVCGVNATKRQQQQLIYGLHSVALARTRIDVIVGETTAPKRFSITYIQHIHSHKQITA